MHHVFVSRIYKQFDRAKGAFILVNKVLRIQLPYHARKYLDCFEDRLQLKFFSRKVVNNKLQPMLFFVFC